MAVHPAGFLASSSRTGWPAPVMVENRPATSVTPSEPAEAVSSPSGAARRRPATPGASRMGAAAMAAMPHWPG